MTFLAPKSGKERCKVKELRALHRCTLQSFYAQFGKRSAKRLIFLKLQSENDCPQLEDEHPPPPPVWHIVKTLTSSDIGHLCWLLLNQDHIATLHFHWNPVEVQNISKGEKVQVLIKDAGTGFSEHRVVICRWLSNGMYVMQSGWRPEFVLRRGLKAGDEIGLSWNSEESCFLFSVFKARLTINTLLSI